MFLLFSVLGACDVVQYDYVNTERGVLYTFDCKDELQVGYLPVEKLGLKLRSTRKDINLKVMLTIEKDTNVTVDLGDGKEEDGYYLFEPKLIEQPLYLTFTCKNTEGTCAIAPLSYQHVTSTSGITTLGILAVCLVGCDIGILIVQFLTFHRKKKLD